MKKFQLLLAGIAGLLLFTLTNAALAADSVPITITGEAMCAKCQLHLTDKCQTVIQAESNGQTVTSYLADNDLSKAFHKNICTEPKKVTATGTVANKDGKSELTVTKIDVVN